MSDFKPLKIGFIGGGINSAVGYAHYVACRMDNRWKVETGCFSRDVEINKETAHRYEIVENRRYLSIDDLIRSEKDQVDAYAILTPTPSHYDNIMKCLDTEVPIICEKALATEYGQALNIVEKNKSKNGFLALTYNYTGYPMVRELRDMIRRGHLGKILHFQVEMPQEGFIRLDTKGNKPSPQAWRLADLKFPTIYLDLATHLHQLVLYLTGMKPISVVGDQTSGGWFSNIIDNVQFMARYGADAEVLGNFWFSKSAMGYRNGLKIRIYGTLGSAEWVQMNPEEINVAYQNGTRTILDRAGNVAVANQSRYTRFKAGHPAGYVEAFANLYYDIADCLKQYKETGCWTSDEVFGPEIGAEGLLLLETVAASVHSRKWEEIKYD